MNPNILKSCTIIVRCHESWTWKEFTRIINKYDIVDTEQSETGLYAEIPLESAGAKVDIYTGKDKREKIFTVQKQQGIYKYDCNDASGDLIGRIEYRYYIGWFVSDKQQNIICESKERKHRLRDLAGNLNGLTRSKVFYDIYVDKQIAGEIVDEFDASAPSRTNLSRYYSAHINNFGTKRIDRRLLIALIFSINSWNSYRIY